MIIMLRTVFYHFQVTVLELSSSQYEIDVVNYFAIKYNYLILSVALWKKQSLWLYPSSIVSMTRTFS